MSLHLISGQNTLASKIMRKTQFRSMVTSNLTEQFSPLTTQSRFSENGSTVFLHSNRMFNNLRHAHAITQHRYFM